MKTIDLQKIRKSKKKTQQEIADIVGCKQSFISQIENKQDTMPESWIPILQQELDIDDISDFITYIDDAKNVASSHNGGTTIAGNGISVNKEVDKFIDLLKSRDELLRDIVKEKDAQISRLIGIIEQLNKE